MRGPRQRGVLLAATAALLVGGGAGAGPARAQTWFTPIPPAGEQGPQGWGLDLPLPDDAVTRGVLRRWMLRRGTFLSGSSTPRLGWAHAAAARLDGSPEGAWLAGLAAAGELPQGHTPVRFFLQAGLGYAGSSLRAGWREQWVHQEPPLLLLRGIAGGTGWHSEIELEWRRKWAWQGRGNWTAVPSLRHSDRQVLRRAVVGARVGPFLVEAGRLGRDNVIGRSGGLMLGDQPRFLEGIALEAGGERWSFQYLYAPLEGGMTDAERARIGGLDRLAFPDHEKSFLWHRLTWRPRENLRLGVSEAALFYGRRPLVSDLLPVLSQHDQYRDYDNMMWAFDAHLLVRPGLGIYAELAVDDVRAGLFEHDDSDPSALGLLAGIEWLRGDHGLFVEGVWTSARLYRYEHPLGTWNARLRFGTLTEQWIDDLDQPLGHPIGPAATGLYAGWRLALATTVAPPPDASPRGHRPPPEPALTLRLGWRRHRGVAAEAGTLPRPIPLTDAEEPFLSRARLITIGAGIEVPLATTATFKGGVHLLDLKSRPRRPLQGPAVHRRGVEIVAALRLFLL